MLIRVKLPRDSGPWLFVDGEYSAHDDQTTADVARAIGFPPDYNWPYPAWCESKNRTEQRLAWYGALCYRIRGQWGAREVET